MKIAATKVPPVPSVPTTAPVIPAKNPSWGAESLPSSSSIDENKVIKL